MNNVKNLCRKNCHRRNHNPTAKFLIYDMETLAKLTKILLSKLPDKFLVFNFLVDHTKTKLRVELELPLKVDEIVGKLYDSIHDQYLNPNNEHPLASLNKLYVRVAIAGKICLSSKINLRR